MSIGPIFIQRTSAGSQNPEDTLRGSKLGSGGDRGTANKSRAKSPRGHYRDRSYSQSSDSESQADGWIPPHEWLSRAMKLQPDVLMYREKLKGILGVDSFGAAQPFSTTEAKDVLHPDVILGFIDAFFEQHGFMKAREALHSESQIFHEDNRFRSSTTFFFSFRRYLTPKDVVVMHETFEQDDIMNLIRLGATPSVFDRVDDEADDTEVEIKMESITKAEEDVNIWDEQGPDTLIFSDDPALPDAHSVKGATLNQLVTLICTTKSKDSAFKSVFFGSIHSFTTPEKVLKKLIQRYQCPTVPSSVSETNIIVALIKHWFDVHPLDFTENVRNLLSKFIEGDLIKDGHRILAQKLQQSQPEWERAQASKVPASLTPTSDNRASISLKVPPEPKVPKNIFSPTLSLDDIDEEEVARQMTILDYELYTSIKYSELCAMRWIVDRGERAKNVVKMLNHYNAVARWVSKQMSNEDKKEKIKEKHFAKVLLRFVKLLEHLFALKNFNSMYAIVSGLQSSASFKVTRLARKELSKEMQQTFLAYEEMFRWENGAKGYRRQLATSAPPCIPALIVHLQDLAEIEESETDTLKNDDRLINWAKRESTWEIVKEIVEPQVVPYSLYKVQQICDLLIKLNHVDNHALLKQDASPFDSFYIYGR